MCAVSRDFLTGWISAMTGAALSHWVTTRSGTDAFFLVFWLAASLAYLRWLRLHPTPRGARA